MALINCPNCGMSISDQSERCVHCGYELKKKKTEPNDNTPKQFCTECGVEIPPNEEFCPSCGYPVKKANNNFVNFLKKNFKWILIVSALVLFLIVGTVLRVVSIKKMQMNYPSRYQQTLESIVDGVDTVDRCCRLIINVWEDAEAEDYDSETEQFTCPDGDFVSPKKAIKNLYKNDVFKSDLEKIERLKKNSKKSLKKLKRPIPSYEKAYDDAIELYDIFVDFSKLTNRPNGELEEYQAEYDNFYNMSIDSAMELQNFIVHY